MKKLFGALTPVVVALALAQVAASTAAGLSLTVASVTAFELSGLDQIAGLAQTSMVVGASVLTMPLARISAHYGRRAALVLGYTTAALGALVATAAVSAESWPVLLVGLFLVGGGTVASLAARFAAADAARAPREVAPAIGFVLWAATVGSIAGPNLVNLAGTLGDGAAFLLLAGLYVLAAAIAATCIPASLGARTGAGSPRTKPRQVVRLLRQHPIAVQGLTISALSHVTMVALMAMAPVHLHHASAPAALVGLVMSAHLAAMYILSPLFGALTQRFGALRLGSCGLGALLLSAAILAVGAVGAVGGEGIFAVGLVLLGLSWSMGMIAGSTLVTQGLDPVSRNASQSVTDLALNLGGGVASLIAGLLVATVGYSALAILLGVIVAGGAVVVRISTGRY